MSDKYDNPILNEREKTHGDFHLNANAVKIMFYGFETRWKSTHEEDMPNALRLAIHEVFHKLARLASNPKIDEHYDDIIGYIELAKKHR